MADRRATFFVLVGDEVIQAYSVDLEMTVVSFLQIYLQSPERDPSDKVKRLKGRSCNFYSLTNPVAEDEGLNISEITASLHDASQYTKLGHNKHLRSIAAHFEPTYIYLIIEDASDSPGKVAKLKQGHADLYRCLEIKVRVAGQWTKDDVDLNGGIFVDDGQGTRKPSKMLDLENKLRGKRSFSIEDDDPELSIARHYKSQFASSYVRVSQQEPASVKDSREFIAFYTLLRCYCPDALRYKNAASSSLKAYALKAHFIIPSFFSGRNSTDNLLYQEETHLKFPLFISCPVMSAIPRRYAPASDFSVCLRGLDLPLIIAEVISEKSEQDRFRMLVQAIALARLAFYVRLPGSTTHPFIVAIYITAGLVAERYILMKAESDTKVYITQKDFDLTSEVAATAFQREMYNLALELESIVNQLDANKRIELDAIKKEASGMMSLHSSGAWTAAEGARGSGLDAIEESNEDNLGVFNNNIVLADLAKMNCKVAYVAFGHPNIAPIQSLIDGQLVGCLKFVKEGGKEIEILQYLASLDFESNHTVRPTRTWSITGGSIISMPAAGNPLTKLDDKDTFIWPVMVQLFEAVKFMHDHNVAHMDLKPSNILIPSEYGTLTIIDFGLSVRVKTPGQLLQSKGSVGTEGYIAPEVGHMKFSPIRADLWSTGKVVEEICMLCRPSPSRDWLLALSKELLNNDFNKRPMMSEVLQQMLNHAVIETPGDSRISSVISMSSWVADQCDVPMTRMIQV